MTSQAMGTVDYRLRALGILALSALVSVALAAFAIFHQASLLAPKSVPGPLFPGLASQLQNVARIRVESKKAVLDVVRHEDGRWTVPERANYPASLEEVQKSLVGLAALQTIEPKTSRPDWFHYLNLDAPPKGNGVRISIGDSSGKTIASAIFGATEDIGDPSGATGIFVLKAGETQSWLARSVFEPKPDPGDWMDKTAVKVDRERIQEVDVTPLSGAAYIARRERPNEPDFKLLHPPSGREPANEAAADGVASALAGFGFEDARPVGQVDFSKAARITTKTFDGLTVTATVAQIGPDYWAKLVATADPAHPEAQREAVEIAAQTSPWAYKLPAYEGQLFTTTLESLLKPEGAPAKTEE